MKETAMTGYVDGFVLPIPKKNVKKYEALANAAGAIWMDHGALDYFECIADDVPPGKLTSFPMSVKLKKDEVVFFSWITYKSRKHRDQVLKKVMTDDRMLKLCGPDNMPFDGKRMIWGGFTPLVTTKTALKTPAKKATKKVAKKAVKKAAPRKAAKKSAAKKKARR